MEGTETAGANNAERCQIDGCDKDAIVWLSGRALCAQHYLQNVNEVNDLGLTPDP